ncbi:MAG TPA: PilZ domain-containing protein [Sphingomonadaceae bacterium]|nr:PilZ domain-containing protein [Sphingomonadaceae bacterium]
MSFGNAKPVQEERRATERSEVARPARLRTPVSSWQGEMTDISVAGARFRTANPPKEGTEAFLNWDDYETFCRVVWTRAGECGVRFEREIPELAVAKTVTRHAKNDTFAALGNIPIGKRRRMHMGLVRGGISDAGPDEEAADMPAHVENIQMGKRRSADDGVAPLLPKLGQE